MDNETKNAIITLRQTAAHLHTLSIAHGQRLERIEYYAKSTYVGIVVILGASFLGAVSMIWSR